MKKIYAIPAAIVMLILLFYAGTTIANRGAIKINYTENKVRSKYTATYPGEASGAVMAYIDQWTGQAVQRSGALSETMKLKFSNGISCRVHAKGRNVEIIAYHADNDAATLACLKKECKIIDSVILAKSR